MTQANVAEQTHEALFTGQQGRLLNEAELDQVGGGIEFSAFGYTFAGGESFAPCHYYASITNSRGNAIYYKAW